MEFSKLKDTEYPYLSKADPYAFANVFDYTRWVPNTRIRLVNVLWNADYSNTVKFNDDAARDEWFDSQEGAYELTLTTNARIVPDGTVKLPLPYDVAAKYNYLYIDLPVATSMNDMLDYETENGKKRWYFFITDIRYSAPSTTVVSIEMDVWTNFINSTKINYLMLERGHAPVAASDTKAYLTDPIHNNRYLLAPDVNYDDSTVVADSAYKPIGDGDKWFCIASTIGYEALAAGYLGSVTSTTGGAWIPPSYSNTEDWYGYQLKVDGYTFDDGSDWTDMAAFVDPYLAVNGNEPNGLCTYAVPGTEAKAFLTDMKNLCPVFYRTIKGAFVVSRDMMEVQQTVEFCGHTISVVYGKVLDLGSILPEIGTFGFTEEQQRFAKLYTYPYSVIEVSNNDGQILQIRVEGLSSDSEIVGLTALGFPVLDCRVYIGGVNGSGSHDIEWKTVSGGTKNVDVPHGDWNQAVFEFTIPTYPLYLDGRTSYKLDHSATMQSDRASALAAYHNSVRIANMNRYNSEASADTGYSNAVASADTARDNAIATADALKTNIDETNTAAYNNANASITANNANTAASNSTSSSIQARDNGVASDDTGDANTLARSVTAVQNETSIATTANTNQANMLTSTVSGAANGAMSGETPASIVLGAIAGGILGNYTAGVSSSAASSNAVITAQANSEVTEGNALYNSLVVLRHIHQGANNTNDLNDNRTTQNTNNNTAIAAQRDNNFTANEENAQRTQKVQTDNANATYTTAEAVAKDTRDTSKANALRSDEISVMNSQETLEATQTKTERALNDAQRANPVELCSYSGNGEQWWYGRNGLQVRYRKQSDSAIAQTTAQFARYGYALNQIWSIESEEHEGLNLMRHFTYWKASDIWIDVKDSASSMVGDELGDVFRAGTTVWSNPDEIGKVDIYDN